MRTQAIMLVHGLLCVLCILTTVVPLLGSVTEAPRCNATVYGAGQQSNLTFTVQGSTDAAPVYCWYRFEGEANQVVQVDVKEFNVGAYDTDTNECNQGYLRISDKEVCSTEPDWLPPTTLCGNSTQRRVKRYTTSHSALVEIKANNNRRNEYNLDVAFIDIQDPSTLPYGDLSRSDGRIKNTKCDWLIPVDRCDVGFCRAVSPLFPGIYPPNTRCQYLFTNFENGRIELIFGRSQRRGDIQLKSDASCSEDFIEIYDGTSTLNPLLGRWCGTRGAEIISSGPSLFVIFQSGPGGPPFDYGGFDINYTDRWKLEHEGGRRVKETLCDWHFDSAYTDRPWQDKDIHTPDHHLPKMTTCYFNFTGRPYERIALEIGTSGARSPACNISLEVFDGDRRIERLCPSPRRRGRIRPYLFNSTSSNLLLAFHTVNGYVSKSNPMWITYKFWNDTESLALYRQAERQKHLKRQYPHWDKVEDHNTASSPSSLSVLLLISVFTSSYSFPHTVFHLGS